MASECKPGDCGAFGHCVNGACVCVRFHLGTACQLDYIAMVGSASWSSLVVIACCLQSIGVIAAAWRFVSRGLRTGTYCQSCGPRDVAAWLNFAGSFVRILWFAGFASGWNVASRVTDGLLLRLPQAAWVGAYLCIVLVWGDIMASAIGRTPPQWHVWGVVVAVVLVTLSTGSITVVDNIMDGGFGGHPGLREAGDITFTFFVVCLSLIGAYAANRLRRLANSLADGVRDLTSHDDRVRAVLVLGRLQQAFRMTIISVTTAWILVLCVVIIAVTGSSPDRDPQAYLAYMFVIHCIVEPSAAVVLLVVTQQDRLPRPRGHTAASSGGTSVSVAGSPIKTPRSSRSGREADSLLSSQQQHSYSSQPD